MPANPAVVPDRDGLGKLDVFSPTLHLDLVCGGEDRDVGPQHNAVPDGDNGTIKDREIESRVEPISEADVGAVIDSKRGLNVGVLSNVAKDVSKHLEPLPLK